MNPSPIAIDPPTGERPLALVTGTGSSLLSVAPDTVETLFKTHGALLLRGFAGDVAEFRAFAERLCKTSVFNDSPGRESIDEESHIQTVNLGADIFPLHPELSREAWRPDACLFYCIVPPASGGETTVCDGTAIVDALPPALVEQMAARKLMYIREADPSVIRYWLGTDWPSDAQLASPPPNCPYWFRRIGGRIIRGFTRPLLHRPMFDDRPAFGNFLLFARDYLHLANFPCLDDGKPVPEEWLEAVRAAAAPITYPIEWRAGDLVVLDNSRFMHGRRAITDPLHRRIASYFGYIGFAPPRPDEPADPIWRREQFRPPERSAH